jgi:hypothetical protein
MSWEYKAVSEKLYLGRTIRSLSIHMKPAQKNKQVVNNPKITLGYRL